mmetsp:Transcript_28845/g.79215  ORF Transcript_28845/g.79215 Transcript_28845/m.79215 type:complete len:363 (-) Transcript_28845:215-1303(-)
MEQALALCLHSAWGHGVHLRLRPAGVSSLPRKLRQSDRSHARLLYFPTPQQHAACVRRLRPGHAGAEEQQRGRRTHRRAAAEPRPRAAFLPHHPHLGLRRLRGELVLLRRHVLAAAGHDQGPRPGTRVGDDHRRPLRRLRARCGHGPGDRDPSQARHLLLPGHGRRGQLLLRLRGLREGAPHWHGGDVPIRRLRLLLGAGHVLRRLQPALRRELPDRRRLHGRQHRLLLGPPRGHGGAHALREDQGRHGLVEPLLLRLRCPLCPRRAVALGRGWHVARSHDGGPVRDRPLQTQRSRRCGGGEQEQVLLSEARQMQGPVLAAHKPRRLPVERNFSSGRRRRRPSVIAPSVAPPSCQTWRGRGR